MYFIRPFQPTENDYQAIVSIHNTVWPDERPLTVAMCRQNDEEWPADVFHQRLVAEQASEIVGQGSCYTAYWLQQPGLIHIDFQVHPEHSSRGVEELLYDAILAHARKCVAAVETLATSTREDRLERVQFLLAQGFQPVMRSPKASLAVNDFQPERFQAAQEKVAQQGIHIYTLAELRERTPDWKQRLHELQWAIRQDVPAVEPLQFSYADFERMVLDDPALDAEAWFVAVDPTQTTADGGEHWVGQSNLWINDPTYQRLDTGLTGVIRSHRRRGIATAIKLRTIEFAQRRGARTIATSNEEKNPMYQINLMLGFQPKPAWVSYRKKVISDQLSVKCRSDLSTSLITYHSMSFR